MIGYLNEYSGITPIYCWEDLVRKGSDIIPWIDRRRGHFVMFNYDASTGQKVDWRKIKRQVIQYFDNLAVTEFNEVAD